MPLRLARLRLRVLDPEAAAARYATLLGRAPEPRPPGRGRSAPRGVRRFGLENVALDLEAREASGGAPSGDAAEGLAGLVFAAADLADAREAARERGLDPRRAQEGGAGRAALELDLSATRGVPIRVEEEEGGERGAGGTERPGADAVRGLDHVVIRTAEPEASRRLYGEALGLRLALDRSFPQWGVRLLFFRVGGLTVELAAPLREAEEPAGRDRLWGLSWRVDDVAAARERLAGLGLDVSPVRAGRKPGTRVATVRDGTCGVPTLLIGPEGA